MRFTNFELLMECEIIRLSNGLRVVFQRDTSIHTVHCGFIVNAGSRDEHPHEHGLAHFIEHCLFKGTKKRKAFHILSRLDSVGGEVNAYTTKEETCLYASCLKEHFGRASELLFDILFASSFPEREIAKERSVILDEINSYKDAPDEMVQDEFEERMYPHHPMGRNILGEPASLEKLDRSTIAAFLERLYTTDEIVFSCVGNITRRSLMSFLRKKLETIPASRRANNERSEPTISNFLHEEEQSVHQVHSIIGGPTIGLSHENRRSMVLLNNVLGGPALNSRLNLNIRERLGYCYYIESNYSAFTDTGLLQIYFGTDPAYYKRTTKLIRRELNQLMDKPLSHRMLKMAKAQLLGQIALAQEQRSGLMLSIGRALLHFDKVDDFESIEDEITGVTATEIQGMAQQVFAPANLSQLSFVPN